MRKLLLTGTMFVLAGLALFGQAAATPPFAVQYVDGSVQVQLKGQTTWKTLKVKDEVPVDATLKVAKGAMIELARDKTVLTLIKEGTYPMAGMIAKVQSSGTGVGSTVAAKIKAVASEPVQSSTTGGVRAAKAGEKPDWNNGGYSLQQKLKDDAEGHDYLDLQFRFWGVRGGYADRPALKMYEEYWVAVDDGVRALMESTYDKAIQHLRDAVTEAIFDDEVKRANYLLAVAYAEGGSPARAWKILSELQVGPDDLEYKDFLIRKAQLQVDSLLNEDAIATLKPLLDPLSKDEFGQAACLVAYYAFKGLDRAKEAADAKQKGLSITYTRTDEKGNQVQVTSETAKILATLP
jgi:hypothetical protein